MRKRLIVGVILAWVAVLALGGGGVAAAPPTLTYAAADTLRIAEDSSPAAARLLGDLAWTAEPFLVAVQEEVGPGFSHAAPPDALVSFPSPRPREGAAESVNTVMMEWYAAEGAAGAPPATPAVLILHILDGRMIVERGIARTLAQRGVHAFVMHMPGYGARELEGRRLDGATFFELSAQSVADARRARDAIAALPGVAEERISIQGTSLGGFITAAAAAVDAAFDHTFIMLAGGNLFDMLQNGRREAAMIRRALERAGYEGERLRALCDTVEPTHIAHRLDAARTWMFSAAADQVVPIANARALAAAAGLDDEHHVWIPADHYTGLLHLPRIINTMATTILSGN